MPRPYLAGERTLLSGDYNVLARVELKRPTGTWIDVTAIAGGRNFFDSFKWSRQIDAPVMMGTLTFLRELTGVSIAPLVGGSALNNVGLTYAPILAQGNAVRFSTACVAVGAAPVTADWKEMFLGRVDDPSVGGDEGLVPVAVSDIGAWLVDQNIDTERAYGSPTGVALETVIQAILTDNPSAPLNALLGAPVTLSTPVSPSWNVKSFTQAKTNVMDAIRTLAQQIGWDVRFVYDAAGVYRLTLFQPQRTKTVADYSIAVRDYYAIPTLDTTFANVRTRFGGSYLDATTHTRLTRYVQSDTAHTDQYGIRYMEVNEADTSNIDTATEMDLMLNAMKSDLQDPPATHVAEMPYFWLAELGDLASHAANSVHYDSAQKLAVVGFEHTVTREAQSTLLTTGGHVVGNNTEWIAKQSDGNAGAGPSLDVTATHGPTTTSISYIAGSPGLQLSINGGAHATAPASPIVVTRPAAGSPGIEYSFRLRVGGQTVTDSVTVLPIDANTVTPDLAVTPSAPAATTQDFTPTSSNPSGGVAPTMSVTIRGATGLNVTTSAALADGTTYAIASGDVIRVNRPAFDTVIQASVSFAATLAGGGSERIQRTILNQVKTVFGPSLDVTASPGPTSYSIVWSGSGGTVQLSINNGAYATAPASPITATRPAAGSNPDEYSFRVIADGQTIIDSVSIQPVGGVDSDTVTPSLTVVPSAPAATTQDFTPTSSNPKAGGPAPTMHVILRGTTGTNVTTSTALAVNTVYSVANSDVIRANRPAFDTVIQASVEFEATIAGGGSERIQRSILNQVKTTFGPSLDVTPSPGPTSYALYYTGSGGTVELSNNNGTYATAGASPISVTRPAAGGTPLEYSFRIIADGQTIIDSVTVQPVDKDTVTPNLAVLPSAPATTTQDFTLTSADPNGGAAPTMTVILRGTSGSYPAFPLTLLDSVTYSGIPTGAVITVNRPAFNTTTQASLEVSTTLAGGGTERIYRTILNQVKDQFGPNLSVQVTPGPTSYSIVWSGSGVLVSINGAAFTTPAASPIAVSRNAFGGGTIEYVFSGTQDGRTVTVAVTIPQQADKTNTKTLTISNQAFQPVRPGQTWQNDSASLKGGTVGTVETFGAYVPMPQGVTITQVDMLSKAGGAGTLNNTLQFFRQNPVSIGASTLLGTATRVAAAFDIGGTDSITGLSEVTTGRAYCLLLGIEGSANHEFYAAVISYSSPAIDTSI